MIEIKSHKKIMRALIVDDSRSMRMILGKALKEAGFQISEAADGREALDRLNRGDDPDLVLVDWNMPVMNGYELVCAVRANPLLSNVRLMMVTTESSMGQLRQAMDAGADEYLMKPFTKEQLVEKLTLLG